MRDNVTISTKAVLVEALGLLRLRLSCVLESERWLSLLRLTAEVDHSDPPHAPPTSHAQCDPPSPHGPHDPPDPPGPQNRPPHRARDLVPHWRVPRCH
jgi:hypothetical protein